MNENTAFNQTEPLNLSDPELYLDMLHFVINLLKSHDQTTINTFKREVVELVEREDLNHLLLEAMYCLVETDFETFLWALHHYDVEFYVELKRQLIVSGVKRMIERGFIPGRDFSAIPAGGLVIHPVAKAVLLENPSALSSYLFRDILHTFNLIPADSRSPER